MRLKWLPVRLRGRRRVSRVAVDSVPARRPSTALHFCGEPANVSCPRPRKASWVGVSALPRGELIARRRVALRGATEESCESFARCGAGLLREAGPLSVGGASEASTACSGGRRCALRRGGRSHLASQSLVPGWPHPTRLETRTKECNMRASPRVANPSAQ